MLSRRATLKGGAATVAVIAGAGAVEADVAAEDPVVALEKRLIAVREEIERLFAFWDQQYAKLPGWAQSDETGGWPDVSDLPAFKARMYLGVGVLSRRPSLAEVKRYNQMQSNFFNRPNTPSYQQAREQGRARVRAWIARYRESKALKRELGVDDWDDRMAPYFERQWALEDQMAETPAQSYAGLAAKMRLYEYLRRTIDMTHHPLPVSVLADTERLAGRAES